MALGIPEMKTIHEMLSKSNEVYYNIPNYQREYSWGSVQLDDLWADLIDVAETGQTEHFFGQMVTNTADGGYDIIDGQQRLTTSILLLAAMRDTVSGFLKANLTDDEKYEIRRQKDTLNESYLINKTGKAKLRLPVENDVAAFMETLILNGSDKMDKEDNATANNLLNAYNYFMRHLKQYMTKENELIFGRHDQFQRVKNLIDVFTMSFKVIIINTESTKDGFIIFETLNARGKSLEEADLLKNLLLSFLENSSNEYALKWEHIFSVLERKSDATSRFIRAYWAFNEILLNSNKLYRSMKKSKKLSNVQDAVRIINDLDRLVEVYHALDKGKMSYFVDKELGRLVNIAHAGSIKTFHPIILAMYDHNFTEADIRKVMNKIIGVYVVNSFIIGETGNDLEKNVVKVAQNIKKEIDNDISAIIADLSRYQKREQVKTQIMAWTQDKWKPNATKGSFGHRTILAYMLDAEDNSDRQSIYDYCKRGSKFKIIRLTNGDFLTGDIVNRIGNFTLLEKSLAWDENWDLKNKVKVLRRSDVVANKALSEQIMQWNAKRVIERNEHFADLTPILW
ncbi:MAG: DUF262 domain-containing protein [Bacillota bacterium]|nr:DUF262 domain-containing protein [Bacillota bacterium]